MFNFLNNLSTPEIIVIGIVLILFFGAKFVTKLGKVSGETAKEVKKIKKNISDTFDISDKK
jgi:Sec-independent protein translocase protein TatA